MKVLKGKVILVKRGSGALARATSFYLRAGIYSRQLL